MFILLKLFFSYLMIYLSYDEYLIFASTSHENDVIQNIDINSMCNIESDIKSITHNIDRRHVVIELYEYRRCSNPTFLIRLSGTALYKLKLIKHIYEPKYLHNGMDFFQPKKNIYMYSYPIIVDPGLYYLEIVVLYCTTIDYNDYKDDCIENVEANRNIVNGPYEIWLNKTKIDYQEQLINHEHGRWIFKPNRNHDNIYNHNTSTPLLLPTRYQKKNCNHHFCEENKRELWQHYLYHWIDQPNWINAYNNNTLIRKDIKINICFIGSSHSRLLTQYAKEISNQFEFIFIEVQYHKDIHANLIYSMKYNCMFMIIGATQWSVSWAEHDVPYTEEKFKNEINNMLQDITTYKLYQPNQVFIRSTNYNSLGSFITSCPPFDYRTPVIIDMLNKILYHTSNTYKIPYIDMNHIIGPMWDSAEDYCHSLKQVYKAQIEFILYTIFTYYH